MDTTLMTYAGPVQDHASATRTGGVPWVPAGFVWPRCAQCSGPMCFLLRLPVNASDAPGGREPEEAGYVLTVFMCQNDPGLCEEWDPFEGGNRALLFPNVALAPASVPMEERVLSPEVCGVDHVVVDADTYHEAREDWARTHGRSTREVLGRLGGVPSWLQGDATPGCPSCERPMDFKAQFEEGHDHRTAMNFGGGGLGYVFACTPCEEATFLWQC